jgi:hypothetical protein
MVEALVAAGVPHEVYRAPGGHIDTFLDDDRVTARALVFLARWLRGPVSQAVQRPGVGSDMHPGAGGIRSSPGPSGGRESE